jgi:hypothetical protein
MPTMADLSNVPRLVPRFSDAGWRVDVEWPDGRIERIGGFKTDTDALIWIYRHHGQSRTAKFLTVTRSGTWEARGDF